MGLYGSGFAAKAAWKRGEHAGANSGQAWREQAAAELGVAEDATRDEIRAAFTARVKEQHPDAGGPGGDISSLKRARDYLLTTEPEKELLKQELTCPLCGGSGMVPAGFGSAQCASCGGTGNVIK
jgi:hypothetical protein